MPSVIATLQATIAELRDANLTGADLTDANLSGATLVGVKMEGVKGMDTVKGLVK